MPSGRGDGRRRRHHASHNQHSYADTPPDGHAAASTDHSCPPRDPNGPWSSHRDAHYRKDGYAYRNLGCDAIAYDGAAIPNARGDIFSRQVNSNPVVPFAIHSGPPACRASGAGERNSRIRPFNAAPGVHLHPLGGGHGGCLRAGCR
ncbi:MAG TPA: hypothetical protein VFB34_10245 [Chloroflexota bacterium]|nr:hypothetical protein [Chloroflexota bacterium]